MSRYSIVHLPDDEPYRWWKLYPDTIVIHYGEALDTFLLLGDEKALLIDTAYGRGDFPNIVDELREGRELMVVNTHGHYDHTGGNPFFPKVYMHEKAKNYCRKSFSPVDPAWFANMPYPEYECISIDDGFVFELGNRQVEVLYTPAHSDSSLMFIDHRRRLLFCGDEFDAGQANLTAADKVEPFYRNILRLQARADAFDFIMPNHNGAPYVSSIWMTLLRRPDMCWKGGRISSAEKACLHISRALRPGSSAFRWGRAVSIIRRKMWGMPGIFMERKADCLEILNGCEGL